MSSLGWNSRPSMLYHAHRVEYSTLRAKHPAEGLDRESKPDPVKGQPGLWPEAGESGAPPNPISFPSRSRYVTLRTPFE